MGGTRNLSALARARSCTTSSPRCACPHRAVERCPANYYYGKGWLEQLDTDGSDDLHEAEEDESENCSDC